MSFWDSLFKIPREKKGAELLPGQMQGWDDIMKEIGGLKSVYEDPGKVAGYGKTVNSMYAPARSNLNTQLNRSRGAAAERMGGTNATPEMTFGNIEGQYAGAFGGLEEDAMQSLRQILSGENQFGMNRLGMKSGAMSGKGASIQALLESLSGDSTFDDILGGLGSAGQVAGGLGWSPLGGGKGSGGGLSGDEYNYLKKGGYNWDGSGYSWSD